MTEPISDEELAQLRLATHRHRSRYTIAALIARLDLTQEALVESQRRRMEMHGHTAVELFDEVKRLQGILAKTDEQALQGFQTLRDAGWIK